MRSALPVSRSEGVRTKGRPCAQLIRGQQKSPPSVEAQAHHEPQCRDDHPLCNPICVEEESEERKPDHLREWR